VAQDPARSSSLSTWVLPDGTIRSCVGRQILALDLQIASSASGATFGAGAPEGIPSIAAVRSMPRLGIELGPSSVRCVVVPAWPGSKPQTVETEWDPDDPLSGLRELADTIAVRGGVYAAIDLSLLVVRRLSLPPLLPRDKRRLIQLDPSRYFATPGDLVLAVRSEDDLVFAVQEPRFAAWVEALAEIGPIQRIEPGPVAFARALARTHAPATAAVLREDGEKWQILEIRNGRLWMARRPYAGGATSITDSRSEGEGVDSDGPDVVLLDPRSDSLEAVAAQHWRDVEIGSLEGPPGLEPRYLTAYGAALESDSGWKESLFTTDLERTQRWRRVRRRALAATALVAAIVFALFSIDARRARVLEVLEARADEFAEPANEVLSLQTRAEEIRDDIVAIAAVEASRPQTLDGLLELTRRLPSDAWVESIRATPEEWQIDGYAPDAAALVPLFEGDPRFENVRSVAGTSRTRLSGRTYENFSLVLRRVRSP
jgi:hypothetical protein